MGGGISSAGLEGDEYGDESARGQRENVQNNFQEEEQENKSVGGKTDVIWPIRGRVHFSTSGVPFCRLFSWNAQVFEESP